VGYAGIGYGPARDRDPRSARTVEEAVGWGGSIVAAGMAAIRTEPTRSAVIWLTCEDG